MVYARRIGRDESRLKRALATGFYALMERLARVPYQGQAGDFRLMSRRVVDALRQMPERRRFLRGMVAWVGFEQVPIEYRRAGPPGGPRRLLPRAVPARARGAHVVLRRAAARSPPTSGSLTAAVSALAAAGRPRAHARRARGRVERRLWILVAVLFLGGVQLISIGILGRYLARVHEQSLQRPLYLVSRVVTRDGPR